MRYGNEKDGQAGDSRLMPGVNEPAFELSWGGKAKVTPLRS